MGIDKIKKLEQEIELETLDPELATSIYLPVEEEVEDDKDSKAESKTDDK